MNLKQLLMDLDARRRRLGMSKAALARRARVSLPTIHRLLSGRESHPRVDIVASIAAALGVEVRLAAEASVHAPMSPAEYRHAQASKKAKRLVRLLQGTMALEAEAVDGDTLEELEDQNVQLLLAGSNRRLWSD